ncbi:MAG: hypothetical protein CME66_01455 [Halobacteriovoraceae bacterium]|jgi:hypothetical protein|nr:hypothetical protein [Halobacteriovoraceae bacterium]|tara:strand:- start:118 stop:528 length:411 start_codon:yes stop_codon:yes gene_type:complete
MKIVLLLLFTASSAYANVCTLDTQALNQHGLSPKAIEIATELLQKKNFILNSQSSTYKLYIKRTDQSDEFDPENPTYQQRMGFQIKISHLKTGKKHDHVISYSYPECLTDDCPQFWQSLKDNAFLTALGHLFSCRK